MAVVVTLTGWSEYREVHALQQRLVAMRAEGGVPDVILALEHAEVITVGRARGAAASVLDAGDVPVVAVERGGDTTWHGPGQRVVYPIIQLAGARADLHLHLRALEEGAIAALAAGGLVAGRDPRNTGAWVGRRKVCSVGIACRRWVTWHGLALNLTVDRTRFRRIRPCGFDAEIMTTVADEGGRPEAVDAALPGAVAAALGVPVDGACVVGAPAEVWRALGVTPAGPSASA